MDASPDAPPDPGPPTSDVERLAPEVKALILSHLEDDIPSLRSCASVCTSWTESARLYLFRRVVCRPAVPTRTWDDFFAFITASPEVTQCIRWLTIDGYSPETGKGSDVGVEQILKALDRIPSLMRLYIQRVGFYPATPEPDSGALDMAEDHDGFNFRVKIIPNSTDTTIKLVTRTICQRSVYLKMLSIRACEVCALMPLYYLLDSIAHIDTFTLRSIYMPGFHKLPTGTLNVRIGTIHVDGAFSIRKHFWKELRRSLTPGAVQGLRVSTRFVVGSESGNRDPSESLLDFLAAFGPDVVSATIDVLGASIHDFNRIAGGEVHPSLNASTFLQPGRALGFADSAAMFHIIALGSIEFPEFPRIDLSSSVSLREMVLYLTTTSVKTGPSATRLYARLLENNCSLLSSASTSLTHIELRFQRYGPHIRAMIDDLRAIDDPTANPGPVRWSTVDEGMFARFPDLEAFTCVLCDGGFVEQHGPLALERAEPVAPDSGVGRQQEFDEYVELLKEVLPRLHGRDLLRFRMSEV